MNRTRSAALTMYPIVVALAILALALRYMSTANAQATLPSYGLEWPGDGTVRRMLYWHDPFPIYDATYIFKVYPRKKTSGAYRYYTTFFWGNDGRFDWDSGSANTYYGAHPYPIPAPGGAGQWEISVWSNDYVTGSEVQWGRWYTQAFRAWRESSSVTHHEFYWDWPDTSKVISQTINDRNWAVKNPPTPAIVIGQAPDFNGVSWGGYPGWEEFNGIIRGIQIYSGLLSLSDIQAEVNAAKSSTAGQSLIWYLNTDPRPSDVTDKKGTGTPHNPLWSGTTALEWTDQMPGITPFDFSLSNGGSQTVVRGQSISNRITATLVSGTAQSVSFSASGLPNGATAAFSPGSCSPMCSSTLTLTTSASTPTGSSTITVTGVAGSLSHTTTFTFTVNAPPPPAPTTTYLLPETGGRSWSTRATVSPVQIGFARIQPDSGTRTPSGMAILGISNGNVLVTEASVPASPLIQAGRIYVEVNGPVNTGIAFANPSKTDDAVISFFFTDATGDFGSGSFTLSANHQIAAFVTESPFKPRDRSSIVGTFTFTSSVPVSIVALRGFTNERGEFLMTTLSVVQPNTSGSATTLAHFADGGGWDTQVILMNPTDVPLSGALQFFGQGSATEAAPLLTMTVNGTTASAFPYQIPGRGVFRFATQGGASSPVQVGSVQITPTVGQSTPPASAIVSFRTGAITITQAGVPAVALGAGFRVYVELSGVPGQIGAVQSGVAIANPSPSPTAVSLELIGMDGNRIAQASVTVPPQGQIARFINELFPSVTTPFQGILHVAAPASSPVAVTGLRGKYNQRGDFLMTTTPPANEAEPSTSVDMMFPQVVTGGGFSTQFILFNGSPGGKSGTFWVSAQDGTPLSADSVLR